MPDFSKLFRPGFFDSFKSNPSGGDKGKYEDFVDEIKELAPKLWEGSPEEQVAARRRFDEIKGSLNTKDAGSAQDLASQIIIDQASGGMSGDLNSEQREIMDKTIKANLALSGAKVATGLVQVIDAAFKKKNLKPPKFPERLYKNNLLATEIAKTQVRAENGDQNTKKNFEGQIAEKVARDEANAKATGNIGQYSALLQGSNRSTNKALLDFAAQEDSQKLRERNRLTQLIGMDQREDQRLQNDMWKKFNHENNAYVAGMSAAQDQINSGFNNLFRGLNEGARTAPYAGLFKKGEGVESAQTDFSNLSARPEAANSISSTRPLHNGEMVMLGNAAHRSPEAVRRFQEEASQRGGFQDYTPGVWDDKTEAVYNLTMGLDPMGTSLNF